MSLASSKQQKLPRKEERRRARVSSKESKRNKLKNKEKDKRLAQELENAPSFLKPYIRLKSMHENLHKKTKGYLRILSVWAAIVFVVMIIAIYGGVDLPSKSPNF